MSDHNKILLIDSGNTSSKWRLVDSCGSVISEGLGDVPLNGAELVYVSDVSAKADFEGVRAVVDGQMMVSHYKDSRRLGVDRWLACLAVPKKGRYLVVDAGTAITLDFVNDGVHEGGWIVPGFESQKRVLNQQTSFEQADSSLIEFDSLGLITEDAIQFGLLNMLKSWVVASTNYGGFRWNVYITGGDRQKIKVDGAKIKDNLVLDGLWRYHLLKSGQIKGV